MTKKNLLIMVFSILIISCTPDENSRNKNPYLPDMGVNVELNLNLPEYNSINFPGNSYVTYNYGINGIVVYNINNSQYTAFELSDPNHTLIDCSTLNVEGIIASCNCEDGNSYNILTGELASGSGQYALKPYRITKRGTILEISN